MRRFVIAPALYALIVLAIVSSLPGCASFTSPDSPAQSLAYAESQMTALARTAADLRRQGVIDDEKAEEIGPIILRGSQALDAGWAAIANGKPETALDYVAIVNTLVQRLSQIIREVKHDPSSGNNAADSAHHPGQPGRGFRPEGQPDHRIRPARGPGPECRGNRSDCRHAQERRARLATS
ncbi:MAG: hypothetical protein RLO11_13095 [Salinisphaeraceae bacterium]